MNQDPLVSIIINNYNYGRFLKEAIESALNQNYNDVEVVVVDDGSTDNSREIIESYGGKIKIVLKENGGQGSAYNAGFAKSSGQWICNLDSDDILLPTAIETLLPLLSDPDVTKIQWPLAVTDKAGNNTGRLSTQSIPPEGDLKGMVLDSGPFYDFHFTTGCLLRRSFLDEVLPMNEAAYRNGADVYLITLAPLFGKIKNVHTPLGTYRAHGENNYRGRTLDHDRIKNYIGRFEQNCKVLAHFATSLGYTANVELWKKNNFNYQWPKRLLQAKNDIARVVPEGEKYILVNDDEWGDGEPVANRMAIPFLEEGGVYSGAPLNDADAIVELERLKNEGASYIAFWWTSFWWLDHYSTFNLDLVNKYQKVMDKDHLIIFCLVNRDKLS